MTMLFVMTTMICYAASLSSARNSYANDGYAVTAIYNAGKQDEGFAAVRAKKCSVFSSDIANVTATTESTSNEYVARTPYGYAQFKYTYSLFSGVASHTFWHTVDVGTWTDTFASIDKTGISYKGCKGRVCLASDDGKYTKLTEYVESKTSGY